VPTPVTRFALAVAAVTAAMLLCGVGTGVAVADPDEQSNSSEPSAGTEPGNVEEPSATPTPSPTATPKSLPEQLRDFLNRPLSIFGNGRVPGEAPTETAATAPTDTPEEKKSDAVTDTVEGVIPRKTEPPKETVPEPVVQEPVVVKRPAGSTAEVRLPFTPPFTIPVPSVPGKGDMWWSINLTDPVSTYATIEQTFATFNSLIADAYAPYNPWQKPKPAEPAEPSMTMRTFQEGPVLDVDGTTDGGDGVTTVSAGSGGDLPVLQAPPVVIPRAVVTNPPGATIRGTSPIPEVVSGGSAGAQTPGLRGTVASTGTVAAEPAPSSGGTAASPMGTPAVRQGYAQSLRVARMGEIAVVALPGVAGLLALTFSGGLIGYRQANSGRYLRQEAVRFVR
jgi:hypothetical protein